MTQTEEVLNPFLKHDGKDVSTATDCPQKHGLKLFVSPVGKPCAACQKQMPNGSRAWRCFPCDFHMCIECHEKGGCYDADRIEKEMAERTEEGTGTCGQYVNPGWNGQSMDPFGDLERKERKL